METKSSPAIQKVKSKIDRNHCTSCCAPNRDTWFCRYFPPNCRREFLNKYWEYGGRSSNTTHGWAPNNSFLTLPRWVLTLTQTMTKTGRLFHTKPLSFIGMGSMQRMSRTVSGCWLFRNCSTHHYNSLTLALHTHCGLVPAIFQPYLLPFSSLPYKCDVYSCALSFTLNGHRQYNIQYSSNIEIPTQKNIQLNTIMDWLLQRPHLNIIEAMCDRFKRE